VGPQLDRKYYSARGNRRLAHAGSDVLARIVAYPELVGTELSKCEWTMFGLHVGHT
jgi:hypothetical protein